MGLSDLVNMWPIGVLALVLGGVVLAFLNCAVAEAVMRLAAWMYTPEPAKRAERVEVWRRILEDAAPGERSAHAASFLWMAVRHLPDRRPYRPSPAREIQLREMGPRRRENVALVLIDVGIVAASWLLALAAGWQADGPSSVPDRAWLIVGPPILLQLVVHWAVGLYRPVWRYASTEEAVRVMAAVAAGMLAAFGWFWVLDPFTTLALPILTAPPVAALLILVACGGVRFQSRLFALERQRTRAAKSVRAQPFLVRTTRDDGLLEDFIVTSFDDASAVFESVAREGSRGPIRLTIVRLGDDPTAPT